MRLKLKDWWASQKNVPNPFEAEKIGESTLAYNMAYDKGTSVETIWIPKSQVVEEFDAEDDKVYDFKDQNPGLEDNIKDRNPSLGVDLIDQQAQAIADDNSLLDLTKTPIANKSLDDNKTYEIATFAPEPVDVHIGVREVKSPDPVASVLLDEPPQCGRCLQDLRLVIEIHELKDIEWDTRHIIYSPVRIYQCDYCKRVTV